MSEKIDRHKRWRLANPDRIREQRERRKARLRGELPPYTPARMSDEERRESKLNSLRRYHAAVRAKKLADPEYAEKVRAEQNLRSRQRYEKIKQDPVLYAAYLERNRNVKRKKSGIALDAPVKPFRLSDEERAERKRSRRAAEREKKRRVYGLALGNKLDAPVKPARLSDEQRAVREKRQATAARPRKSATKKASTKKAEEIARAKRSAMIAEIMSRPAKPAAAPIVCPDPPELQALFAKAAKGEPVRPYDPKVRRSIYRLRGLF